MAEISRQDFDRGMAFLDKARKILSGEDLFPDLPDSGDFEVPEMQTPADRGLQPIRVMDGNNCIELWKGEVKLHLANKDYKPYRKLGVYDYETKTFYVSRSKKKNHIHLKTGNCWGFNYSALKTLYDKGIEFIQVRDGRKKYQQMIYEILENGKFLYYKRNSLDRQVFFPIDDFEEVKIK